MLTIPCPKCNRPISAILFRQGFNCPNPRPAPSPVPWEEKMKRLQELMK